MGKNRIPNSAFAVASADSVFPITSFPAGDRVPIVTSWYVQQDPKGGTAPALSVSRLPFPLTLSLLTVPGEPVNYLELDATTVGSLLGVGSYQKLLAKMAPRVLNGQFATFSFWANSSVDKREVAVSIRRSYGTGGSPSPDDVMGASVIALKVGWQRYSVTFPITPINDGFHNSKVPGTNGDAFLEAAIFLQAAPGFFATLGDKAILPQPLTLQVTQPQLEQGSYATPYEDDVDASVLEAIETDNLVFEVEIPLSTVTPVFTVSGLNLSFIPADVRVRAEGVAGGQQVTAMLQADTVTSDGFSVTLSGLPDGTQTLKFELIPPQE